MAQPQSIAWSGIALRFVACYAVVLVMNHLASSLPGAPQHPVLDLRFGFDSKAVHDTFRVYGQKGRRTYLIAGECYPPHRHPSLCGQPYTPLASIHRAGHSRMSPPSNAHPTLHILMHPRLMRFAALPPPPLQT